MARAPSPPATAGPRPRDSFCILDQSLAIPAIGPGRMLFPLQKKLDDCLVAMFNCYKQSLTVPAIGPRRMLLPFQQQPDRRLMAHSRRLDERHAMLTIGPGLLERGLDESEPINTLACASGSPRERLFGPMRCIQQLGHALGAEEHAVTPLLANVEARK